MFCRVFVPHTFSKFFSEPTPRSLGPLASPDSEAEEGSPTPNAAVVER